MKNQFKVGDRVKVKKTEDISCFSGEYHYGAYTVKTVYDGYLNQLISIDDTGKLFFADRFELVEQCETSIQTVGELIAALKKLNPSDSIKIFHLGFNSNLELKKIHGVNVIESVDFYPS